MTDDELAKLYEDPSNRRIAGRPKRSRVARTQTLSNHVPIRFSPSTMTAMQTLAHTDGVTVSAWIRSLVERELERRIPPQTVSTVGFREATQAFLTSPQPATTAVERKLELAS
jgi:hypothetical protein